MCSKPRSAARRSRSPSGHVPTSSSAPSSTSARVSARASRAWTWNRDVPVIVLGPEEADAVDRVRAFQRGADDYLPRPVVYDELLARIRAVLRRTSPPSPDLIEVGDLAIDRPARVVTVRGEPVHLAGKEFELLVALAAEPSRVFTKDELLRDVWGYRSFTRTRTLDSHVSRLRQKLERAPGDDFVINVWGVGYKLIA